MDSFVRSLYVFFYFRCRIFTLSISDPNRSPHNEILISRFAVECFDTIDNQLIDFISLIASHSLRITGVHRIFSKLLNLPPLLNQQQLFHLILV